MNTALFLDLGGTLVRLDGDEVYVDSAGRVELLPSVAARLSSLDYDLVLVVTNQSAIELGTRTYDEVRAWIEQLNAALDGRIADYWASPRVESAFRKPMPGMIAALADKHFVDLGRSLYVGDSETDRACAEAAGVGAFEWARDFFGWPPTGGDRHTQGPG